LQTFLFQIIYLLILLHTFVILVTSDFAAKTDNRPKKKKPKEMDAPSVTTRQSTRVANLHAAPLAGLNEDTVKKSAATKKSEGKGGKGDSKKVTKKDAKKQDSNKKVAKSAGKTDAKFWNKTKETKKRAVKAKAAAAAKAKKNAKAPAKVNKKPP